MVDESNGASPNVAGITDQKPAPASNPGCEENNSEVRTTEKTEYTWRFWMAFAALGLSALLSALEASIVSTAMPTITADLGAGENYIWIINIYFLTRFVPTFISQLSSLYG